MGCPRRRWATGGPVRRRGQGRDGPFAARPDGGQPQTERRLRHECEQLKLALAEATVQLLIWQKGSEFVDAFASPTSRP
jgi:hypothetical protein